MAKRLGDYKKTGIYNYPQEDINPELKKDKKWYQAHGEAMLHYYTSGNCEIPFDFTNRKSFRTLQAYAQGKQGNVAAKRKLAKDLGNGQFSTKMKEVWDTFDVLPEMFDVIRAINQRQDYEISASCIDEPSIEEKSLERATLKFFLNKDVQDLMNRAQFKPNLPIDPQELANMTASDVDLFFDSGGMVLQRELAAIAACDETKLLSGYKGIENLVNDDLIVFGISGIKNYIDKSTNSVKMEKIDFVNSRPIIPFSHYYDFRDITRAGVLKKMSIAQIKEINPELLRDKEVMDKLIDSHRYMNADYVAAMDNTGQYQNPYNSNPLDGFKVYVLDFQFLSTDYEKYLDVKHQNGNTIYKQVKYDYKLNKQEEKKGAKIDSKKLIKKHKAIWVVGTDILLDYGVDTDVVYYGKDGNKTPRIDYFFAKTGNTSLIERCIPHVDDINLAVVKLRNSIATLPPAPRMVLQQQLIDNVFIGGKKQQPEDLFQTLIDKGYLVVNGVDDDGRPIYQNGKAIDFIGVGGLIEDVTLFNSVISDGIGRIRQVLGLPEGLDGTAGNQYAGLGKTQLSAQASSNALFPTLGRLGDIFLPAFDDVVKKWQIVCKGAKKKFSWTPLGSSTRQILEVGADFSNADFNLEMTLAPNDEEKQFLIGQIGEMSLQFTQSSGQVGVSRAEYLMLYKLIKAGRIDMAMFKIAQIEKRREMAANKKAEQNQKMNIQDQQESAKMASEQERMTLEQKSQSELTKIFMEGMLKQNQLLTDLLFKPKKENETAPDTNNIANILAENEQTIGSILSPQPSPEEQVMAQQQNNIPQNQPIAQ